MRLENPWWLLALIPVFAAPFLARLMTGGSWRRPALLFANLPALARQSSTWRMRVTSWTWVLPWLAMILVVLALARPQRGRSDSVVSSEGIDIMMVVDTSSSMAGEDFGAEKTRLDHVSEVMKEFAKKRSFDRLGLVSFGVHASTRCPLTLDHGLFADFLDEVQSSWHRAYEGLRRKEGRRGRGSAEDLTPAERNLMGTAIGDALLTAVARLEKSETKSRVIVLLTDGENTAGETQPLDGAALAEQYGIRVYAVGAGSDGAAPVTVFDRLGRKRKQYLPASLDEATLAAIAEKTEGSYFHANSRERLEAVYDEIDRLERSEIKSLEFREWDEIFQPLIWAALALVVLERLLAFTWLRRLP